MKSTLIRHLTSALSALVAPNEIEVLPPDCTCHHSRTYKVVKLLSDSGVQLRFEELYATCPADLLRELKEILNGWYENWRSDEENLKVDPYMSPEQVREIEVNAVGRLNACCEFIGELYTAIQVIERRDSFPRRLSMSLSRHELIKRIVDRLEL